MNSKSLGEVTGSVKNLLIKWVFKLTKHMKKKRDPRKFGLLKVTRKAGSLCNTVSNLNGHDFQQCLITILPQFQGNNISVLNTR